ncbi:hypothetical protein BV22DRAFT_1124026 [Leucogyrophana mollusca]|uniref:Uncharacterized protein n=1 Tax=Leucogyrophana mollusca TaxID=85980 RepID=A0ACB8AW87_9AGAM|nr:hypothetical protein BV22DRAFT_1124026 [Leucogyrophana mollusca]
MSDDGELIDEFCDWLDSLDDISELPIPRSIRDAHVIFESTGHPFGRLRAIGKDTLLCQSVRIYEQCSQRHLWITRALVSELRDELDVQYLVSPPVVAATWESRDAVFPIPSWLHYTQGRVIYEVRKTWDIIPLYTVLAFDRENAAKKLAIFKWCSGVEHDLHVWGLHAAP